MRKKTTPKPRRPKKDAEREIARRQITDELNVFIKDYGLTDEDQARMAELAVTSVRPASDSVPLRQYLTQLYASVLADKLLDLFTKESR